MNTDKTTLLSESNDPKVLLEAGLTLASSSDPEDHGALSTRLADATLLGKLDSEKDYQSSPRTLRVTRILEALAECRRPSGTAAFVMLCQSDVFTQKLQRIEALIITSSAVRPPPENLVRFWLKHSGPEDSSLSLVIRAVLDNGTQESLKVFEQKMLEPAPASSVKQSWLRRSVLPNRNGLPLLQCVERLLAGNLRADLKVSLVEVIFDYQASWYSPSLIVHPPLPTRDPEIRVIRKRLAQDSLAKIPLDESLKAVVKTASLDEIGR